MALVAVLLAATFGATYAIGRATRSSKPAQTEVAPLRVSGAVPAVPTVRSVATLPALKREPRRTTSSGSTTGTVTPPSTTGAVSPPSTTGGTGTGGATTGNTTGGGGTTTE